MPVQGPTALNFEIQRSALQRIRHMLLGFEANVLPFSFSEQLREAGLELVPRTGLVEQLRAVKDEGELDTFRRACAITDRMFERREYVAGSGNIHNKLQKIVAGALR